ncbi:MAG TPA: hypothetical protein PKA63_12085 [Oligoflexia bacterium]|nr:hypothetical protein [Oligoflexia bacterium]HMP49394.1 hypothetical protein [Oligoflexia bacterium]
MLRSDCLGDLQKVFGASQFFVMPDQDDHDDGSCSPGKSDCAPRLAPAMAAIHGNSCLPNATYPPAPCFPSSTPQNPCGPQTCMPGSQPCFPLG